MALVPRVVFTVPADELALVLTEEVQPLPMLLAGQLLLLLLLPWAAMRMPSCWLGCRLEGSPALGTEGLCSAARRAGP